MSFQVLLYHGLYADRSEIRGKPAREYVSRDDFSRQVRWMQEEGYALIPVRECRKRRELGESLLRTVALTFDDGKRSDLTLAAPLLLEVGVKATFFIIPRWLDRPNIMGPEAVRELSDMGMEIGSHSLTHPFMTSLTEEERVSEATDSKRFLEDLVGGEVESFSYPHGAADGRVREAVARAGYSSACGTVRGANPPSPDWLMLKRWGIHETTGLDGLRRILVRGTPSLFEQGADRLKRGLGPERYHRWREKLLRRAED